MKIDPKYFNLFAVIVAVFATIAIAYFTVTYARDQRTGFIETAGSGAGIYHAWLTKVGSEDSLRAADVGDRVVVIDFWSTWSDPALASHEQLHRVISAYPDSLKPVIIAAAVRDADEDVLHYAASRPYGFVYVKGTALFQSLKVPGVPSQVVFAPGGRLADIRVGYKQAGDYRILDSLLRSGPKIPAP